MQPVPVGTRRARAAVLPALALAAVTLPFVAGCEPESGAGGGAGAPPADTAAPSEAVRWDTVRVEGRPTPVRVRTVRSPNGFPLPFTSVATTDFDVAETERAGLPALRLVAAFGGHRNEDAFLEVAAWPSALPQAEVERRAVELLGRGAVPVPPESRPGWAARAWTASGPTGAGREFAHLALGRRDGRAFHVLVRYPAEYGDGFGPREALFVESWRWADGTALVDR